MGGGVFRLKIEGAFMRFRQAADHWEADAPDGTTYRFGVSSAARSGGTGRHLPLGARGDDRRLGQPDRFTYEADRGQLYLTRIDYNVRRGQRAQRGRDRLRVARRRADRLPRRVRHHHCPADRERQDDRGRRAGSPLPASIRSRHRDVGRLEARVGHDVRHRRQDQPADDLVRLHRFRSGGPAGGGARQSAGVLARRLRTPSSPISTATARRISCTRRSGGKRSPSTRAAASAASSRCRRIRRFSWPRTAPSSPTSTATASSTSCRSSARAPATSSSSRIAAAATGRRPTRFRNNPGFSFEDPGVRLIDFDGDGLVDVMQTTPTQYHYWRNNGDGSWGAPLSGAPDPRSAGRVLGSARAARRHERRSPDRPRRRARRARSSYWPNLGWGRWGSAVSVAGAPDAGADQARVQLADMNGDGLTDAWLAAGTELRIWLQRGDGRFAAPSRSAACPTRTRSRRSCGWRT